MSSPTPADLVITPRDRRFDRQDTQRRWSVKVRVMLLVTRNVALDRTRGALDLLAQDGLISPRAWRGLPGWRWSAPA